MKIIGKGRPGDLREAVKLEALLPQYPETVPQARRSLPPPAEILGRAKLETPLSESFWHSHTQTTLPAPFFRRINEAPGVLAALRI